MPNSVATPLHLCFSLSQLHTPSSQAQTAGLPAPLYRLPVRGVVLWNLGGNLCDPITLVFCMRTRSDASGWSRQTLEYLPHWKWSSACRMEFLKIVSSQSYLLIPKMFLATFPILFLATFPILGRSAWLLFNCVFSPHTIPSSAPTSHRFFWINHKFWSLFLNVFFFHLSL